MHVHIQSDGLYIGCYYTNKGHGIVDVSLKTAAQHSGAVKKANNILGIIEKGIENKTENVKPVYKCMVLPTL